MLGIHRWLGPPMLTLVGFCTACGVPPAQYRLAVARAERTEQALLRAKKDADRLATRRDHFKAAAAHVAVKHRATRSKLKATTALLKKTQKKLRSCQTAPRGKVDPRVARLGESRKTRIVAMKRALAAGNLTAAGARRFLRRFYGRQLRSCGSKYLPPPIRRRRSRRRRNIKFRPRYRASATLRIMVRRNGRVRRVHVVKSDLSYRPLWRCVRRAVKAIRFPKPAGKGTLRFTYGVRLSTKSALKGLFD